MRPTILANVLCLVLLCAACDSGDGTQCAGGTGGSTTHTTGSGGAEQGCAGVASNDSAECDACRAAACCNEAQACVAEPDCQTWLACEDACALDDFSCLRGCWKGNPAPPIKGEYMACKQRSCAQACGMEACSGAAFNYQDSNDDQGTDGACRACRNEHCCSPLTTCLEDPQCEEAFECYATCPDSACMLSVCNNAEHRPDLWKIAPDWACRSRYCLAECNASESCSAVFGTEGACQTCVHGSCCAETKACSEDTECIIYAFCRRDCNGDSACETACDSAYWIGGGREWVREYCLASQCSTDCAEPARTCGGFAYSPAGCVTCMDQNCCAEGQACGTSAECAGVHMCIVACGGDTACQDECLAIGAGAAVTLHQQLTTCQTAQCAVECPAT
jgi:hypothetical protein